MCLATRTNRTKMLYPIIILAFTIPAFLQTSFATVVDLSKTKNVLIEFTDKDVISKALKSLMPNTYAAGFIGNLEIGRRFPDETIFRRVIEFNNPTNTIQSSILTLTINNGILHYLSVVNDSGSYAVVCDESTILGSSKGNINIRASPKTKSYLTIITAVH